MNTVQSKYKNPDKFIEKLKGEIERLEYRISLKYRQLGRHEFNYGGVVELSVKLNTPAEHPKLLPLTDVRFKGRVIKVERDVHGGSVRFKIDSCYRIEEDV